MIPASWSIRYFSPAVQAEVLSMQAGFLARFLRYADRMERFGPDLGMPHTRAMGGGLFELRIRAAEGIARVFYMTMAGRTVVILHQYTKKAERTPKFELEVARHRMKVMDKCLATRR